MKEVNLNVKLLLDEDVAEWIDNLISNNGLDAELATDLTSRCRGGYIVTQAQLDEILDEIAESDDDSALTDSDAELIGGIVSDVVREALGNLNLTAISNNPNMSDSKSGNDIKQENPTVNDIVKSKVVEFISNKKVSEDVVVDSGDDAEEMSSDDIDALGDMFGFF